MKNQALIAMLLMIFTCFQTAQAHSSIWNMDGLDKTELDKIGITVKTLPQGVGELSDINWIQVTFDTLKRGKDEHTLMVLQVVAKNGTFISGNRAAQKKGGSSKVSMTFAINKENLRGSGLNILISKPLSEAEKLEQLKRDLGNPRFGGYSLSMKRMIDLAGKPELNKATDTEKK